MTPKNQCDELRKESERLIASGFAVVPMPDMPSERRLELFKLDRPFTPAEQAEWEAYS